MVGALLSLVRDNNLSMPPDQAMLLKVLVSLEGAFKKLDPDFDIMVAIQPTLQEVVTDQLSPSALGKRALKIVTQYAELFADLPKEVRRGIYSVKTGNLKMRIELSQFEQLQRGVMRGARLLALASIASAVVIGGALVMMLRQKPKD
jgi:ubiquinone biosynthesis protein